MYSTDLHLCSVYSEHVTSSLQRTQTTTVGFAGELRAQDAH